MLAGGRCVCVADGVDDGQGGEQSGDHRQADGPPDAERADQADGQERPDNRAQVVHRPLEPVGPTVKAGRHYVGQQRIAGRDPQPPGRPGTGPKHSHLPRCGRRTDARRQHGRGRVPPDRHRAPSLGIVGQGATTEPGHPRERIRHALNDTQRRRRRTKGRGQEAGQQRRGDLVTGVSQKAGRPDARHARAEPPFPDIRAVDSGHRRIVLMGCETGPGQRPIVSSWREQLAGTELVGRGAALERATPWPIMLVSVAAAAARAGSALASADRAGFGVHPSAPPSCVVAVCLRIVWHQQPPSGGAGQSSRPSLRATRPSRRVRRRTISASISVTRRSASPRV